MQQVIHSTHMQSSLLQCLLGELQTLKGSVDVRGSVSYVSQEPWVFAGTLRDNILFGEKYDQLWYERVLEACCLEEVRILPANYVFIGVLYSVSFSL